MCKNLGHVSTLRHNECRDGIECLICGTLTYQNSDHSWERKNCIEKLCTKCQKIQKIPKAQHRLKKVRNGGFICILCNFQKDYQINHTWFISCKSIQKPGQIALVEHSWIYDCDGLGKICSKCGFNEGFKPTKKSSEWKKGVSSQCNI